jgi:uncharacterized iron-regulated membrane protein
LAVRILYTLLGLTLPAFYASGLVLWWNKRRQKKLAQRSSRATQSPKSHAAQA